MAHVAESPCGITGCKREVLARGLCRRHYERWREHGDPNVVGRPGPAVNPHIAAMDAAGVTEQQRSRWAAAGLLGITADVDNPARWMWTEDAARRAILIRSAVNAGIPATTAAELLDEGVELAPGVRLRVTWDTSQGRS